jgi:sulfite exporter TauE/SafE
MNAFELGVLATPIAGFVGGLTAAKGLSVPAKITAGGLGFGVGIGVLLSLLGIGWVVEKIAGIAKTRGLKRSRAVQDFTGLILLFTMLILPLPAWLMAVRAVRAIFR